LRLRKKVGGKPISFNGTELDFEMTYDDLVSNNSRMEEILPPDMRTDWRLPTIDELTVIYNNRQTIGKFENVGSYWSSSLYSNDCDSDSSSCYYSISFSYTSDGGTISYGADEVHVFICPLCSYFIII
jgi:hypothetical protein